jgi:hypothetical protein
MTTRATKILGGHILSSARPSAERDDATEQLGLIQGDLLCDHPSERESMTSTLRRSSARTNWIQDRRLVFSKKL